MRTTIVAILTLAWSLGCASPSASVIGSDPSIDLSQHLYHAATLGPGDIFEVRVYQDKELSGKHRVAPDGSIDFPLVGRVIVEGKTPGEIADILTRALADGFLKDPSVTIFVVQYTSKKVFVLGEVKKPGTYPYEDGMSVVQAVTVANGFADRADENGTIITRIEDGREIRYLVPVEKISRGLSPNFVLKPGDIIFVPSSIL